MASGFKSLDSSLNWAGELGDFVQIEFGERTGWKLVAEYDRSLGTVWVVVEHPVSYRVHDERELLDYWSRRDEEKTPVAFAYEIARSAYLDELGTGATALIGTPLHHYLVAGLNTCLEVISAAAPIILKRRPEAE